MPNVEIRNILRLEAISPLGHCLTYLGSFDAFFASDDAEKQRLSMKSYTTNRLGCNFSIRIHNLSQRNRSLHDAHSSSLEAHSGTNHFLADSMPEKTEVYCSRFITLRWLLDALQYLLFSFS